MGRERGRDGRREGAVGRERKRDGRREVGWRELMEGVRRRDGGRDGGRDGRKEGDGVCSGRLPSEAGASRVLINEARRK